MWKDVMLRKLALAPRFTEVVGEEAGACRHKDPAMHHKLFTMRKVRLGGRRWTVAALYEGDHNVGSG